MIATALMLLVATPSQAKQPPDPGGTWQINLNTQTLRPYVMLMLTYQLK